MQIIHKKFRPHTLEGDWGLLIGNFDGVHLGHQALMTELIQTQQNYGAKSAVLTFEPHPKMILQPHIPFTHIYDEETKWRLMAEAGIDACFVIPFTKDFATFSPHKFLEKLFAFAQITKIIVGYDFNFGKDRQGSARVLGELAQKAQVDFTQMEPVKVAGLTVSSTMIRRLLYEGDFALAEKLLGRPWEISGEVMQGRQLGQQLGFPTLNLLPKVLLPLRYGVYAAEAKINGQTYAAACNIGHAPTVGSPLLKAEAHLFDFNAVAYGEELSLKPLRFLREEQRFDNLQALKRQIALDVQATKEFFEKR